MGEYSQITWKKVTASSSDELSITNTIAGKAIHITEVCVAFDDTAIFTVTAKAFIGLKQIAPTEGEFVATGSPRELCVDVEEVLSPGSQLKLLITNNDTSDHYVMLKIQGYTDNE